MSVVTIDIAFGLLLAAVGAGAGWFLRNRDLSRHHPSGESEARFAREVLIRLQNVAADVAAGVGEHTSRVEEISEELTASGNDETEVVVHAVDNLLKANAQMQEQLESADERLQDQARQIESHAAEARTDALTGLANRRAFDDEMTRRLAEFQRHGRGISVMMMDVDHFKSVNDTHGHQVGDKVLRDLAKILRRTARDTDTVARYGGEEFAAILPGTSKHEAAEGAERFRQAIESHSFHAGNTELQVTASFGVAELQKNEDATAVIERSDEALYAAKKSGRNCVFWSDGRDIHLLRDDRTPPDKQSESSQTQVKEPSVEPDRAEIDPPRDSLEAAEADVREDPQHYCDGSCDRSALRRFLDGRLRRLGNGSDRPSVVLVQVDGHAKMVAELGDEAGQLILRATPQFLKAAFRDMKMLATYDTTTFAIVLCGADIGGSVARAERLREAVLRCVLPFADKQLRFSVSVSMAEAQKGDDVPQLLMHAEEALEAATKSGGNSTYFHNGQWSEIAHTLLEEIG
ncbi:MAG: diguanylate cyclase [Thermoguttaceae bacterium]